MVKEQKKSSAKQPRLKSTGQKERRKFERYETALKIQFYVNFDLETKIDFRVRQKDRTDFSKETYSAVSKNVSVEGIGFLTEKALKKGDILLLDVYIPSATEPIHMQGQVRWSCKCQGKGLPEGLYETGVKLLMVNNEPVEKTIFIDDAHRIAWSIVLESVFGNFKHLALRRKKIN